MNLTLQSSLFRARGRCVVPAKRRGGSFIERDKCLERHSQTYDEYTSEREKVQQEEE